MLRINTQKDLNSVALLLLFCGLIINQLYMLFSFREAGRSSIKLKNDAPGDIQLLAWTYFVICYGYSLIRIFRITIAILFLAKSL